MPVWRALGGVAAVEPDGIRYLMEHQQPMLIDARDPEESAAMALPGASNVPLGAVMDAIGDGRLPLADATVRIIVFGHDGTQARAVAEALAGQLAFTNAGYFTGSSDAFLDLLRSARQRSL